MSDMKCIKCNTDLERIGDFYTCTNPHCTLCGDKDIWQELIHTRKALEVALAELQEIDGCCEDNKYADNVYVGLDGHDTRNIALDVKKTIIQIKDLVESKTALEQKDVK